jgi:hypothetical protein
MRWALETGSSSSRRTAARAMPADRAAKIAVQSLLKKRTPARVFVGVDARILTLLQGTLPRSWFEAMIRREFGFHTPPAG